MKPGISVFRFANRIPLLFEAGNDVCTKTATKRINWTNYKISQQTDKVLPLNAFSFNVVKVLVAFCQQALRMLLFFVLHIKTGWCVCINCFYQSTL